MLRRIPQNFTWLAALLLLTTAASAQVSDWSLDEEQSFFAVVTHKEGVASGLAHEHLVVATEIEMQLRADLEEPSETLAEVEVRVEGLVVDDPELNAQWQSELLERELISEEFAQLEDKDRQKIRRSMLSKKQLDVEKPSHAPCPARRGLRRRVPKPRQRYMLGASRTERHARSLLHLACNPGDDDGPIRVDLAQSFTFRDFGIKPYSALLGAIRVADEFDVVIRVVARASS